MARLQKATRDQVIHTTRERLLLAAAGEFAREGYVGANINTISAEAGFAKGTIYNYFASKHALLEALIDETAAAHVAAIVSRVEGESDPACRLERFFRAGFAFVEQHPEHSRVIISAVYGPDAAFKNRVYQAYQRLFDLLIHDIIGAGIAQGVFRPVDPNGAAALVMAIYLGGSSLFTPEGKIWFDPAYIMRFILDGLRAEVR